MRSAVNVLKPVTDALNDAGSLSHNEIRLVCDVELGLYLHEKLLHLEPAVSAWALFSGYPFAKERGLVTDEADEDMLRCGRYSLWTLRRRTTWIDMLESYQRIDRLMRAYDVPDPMQLPARRPISIAVDRWDCYDKLLHKAPPLTGSALPVAEPGVHRFSVGREMTTIRVPDTSELPAPPGHNLALAPTLDGKPLRIEWKSLLKTAAAMDTVEYRNWVGRLRDVQLSTRDGDSFAPSAEFTVSRIQHLLGIVGAGKSTLRDVLTVHLVNNHESRVTVVVGDVAETLKLVALYNTYTENAAAPILGASGKQRHAQRLHRRLVGRGKQNLLAHTDSGFVYLSTSCALNALRPDADELMAFNEAPCSRLWFRAPQHINRAGDFMPPTQRRVACPYWSVCPRHRGARDLVDARIWVATPASLIDSAVPWPQNAERVRYLELACRRSDLVIVDEVDRVQMNLDRMFAPAVPLVGGADGRSLLDEVNEHKIRELSEGARRQLSDRDVEDWTAAVNTVTAATDRLYAMLVTNRTLRDWVKVGYFSAWTLQLRLIDERYPEDDADVTDLASRETLTKLLDRFRDNPFGDRSRPVAPGLTDLINELLHTNYQRLTRRKLREAMERLFDLRPMVERKTREYETKIATKRSPKKTVQTPDEWLAEVTRRFEFTLLLSALEPKLALMNTMWPRVESVLKLGFNEMYQRPPDYGPMVPEAPMGNVLGFQFLMDGPDNGGVQSGELRYFRCSGVGRELLRAMPGLPEVDGQPSTNVLLMSGSSWAGSSSRYHIAVPVGVLIEPEPEEIDRIANSSVMRVEFTRADGGSPLTVSGSDLDVRPEVLRRMAVCLGEVDDGESSPLQRELLALPETRRRILLLVGSYAEAELVADTLHTLRNRWKGRVLRLVSDDDDGEFSSLSVNGDDHHAGILRRGDVDSLAQSRAEILVAPLLAVERGHNILNDEQQAAIGSVYFLARPNPRPDDLGLAVHTVNDWIVRAIDDKDLATWVRAADTLDKGAREMRKRARSLWYRALGRSMAWRRLGDDRDSVTWDLLVLIWQVVGRLVRGGVPARVVFVDAAFMPNLAAGGHSADTRETSLLHSILHVLQPYFTDDPAVRDSDRRIVTALYKPLWESLGRCLEELTERTDPCTP